MSGVSVLTNNSPTTTNHSTIESFKTLPADLTLFDPVCKPFWNTFVKEWSQTLPSCTRTDFIDLQSSHWSESVRRITQKSWFSVKMKIPKHTNANDTMISSPLWQSITNCVSQKIAYAETQKNNKPQPKTNKKRKPEEDLEKKDTKRQKVKKKEPTEKQKLIAEELIRTGVGRGGKKLQPRVKKKSNQKTTHSKKSKSKKDPELLQCTRVRIFPTAEQKQILKTWFGGARWCYNQAVEKYNRLGANSITFFRQTIVNQGLHKGTKTEWLLETPTEVKEEALRDFQKAVKSNLAKQEKNSKHKFIMKFKSVKADSDSICISKKKCKAEVALLENMKSEQNKFIQISWDHNMRICKKKNGSYFLCIPRKPRSVSENQAPALRNSLDGVIALDPGVRTFMTGYTSVGDVYEFCNGDEQRLCRLRAHCDKLYGRIRNDSNINHKKRYKLRKAASALQLKMSNLVDDMHRKICKVLCENYRVIFLPKFSVQQMVNKKTGNRKISKKTVRSLYALKHYTFQQRLLNKATEYPWVKVFIVNEAYTSKTCTHCGWIHQKLGGSKVFHCANCHKSVSRDIGGARNILLRQLGLFKESPVDLSVNRFAA